MIGKVQSGKSSIVRTITQSDDAALGSGFKACTRTARIFDFPEEAPVLRFLDTRGLGEADYDPAEDLAFCAERAHLLLAVARAMDPQQSPVLDALRSVRLARPDWPLIVAQTSLHEGYAPGQNHPAGLSVRCFRFGRRYTCRRANRPAAQPRAPAGIVCCPARQRVPSPSFPSTSPRKATDTRLSISVSTLWPRRSCGVAPAAMVAALEAMPGLTRDPRLQQADPLIMGHAAAAAGGDLVPLAGAVAVSADPGAAAAASCRHLRDHLGPADVQ